MSNANPNNNPNVPEHAAAYQGHFSNTGFTFNNDGGQNIVTFNSDGIFVNTDLTNQTAGTRRQATIQVITDTSTVTELKEVELPEARNSKMRPVQFELASAPGVTRFGFLTPSDASDLAREDGGQLSIQHAELMAVIVSMLKNLSNRLDALEGN